MQKFVIPQNSSEPFQLLKYSDCATPSCCWTKNYSPLRLVWDFAHYIFVMYFGFPHLKISTKYIHFMLFLLPGFATDFIYCLGQETSLYFSSTIYIIVIERHNSLIWVKWLEVFDGRHLSKIFNTQIVGNPKCGHYQTNVSCMTIWNNPDLF